ncbi:MAG: hypothetical protein KAR19_17825 [Bacteroidales bacterium]|nr:hypothetical protein [Bacteroidales bacterium]
MKYIILSFLIAVNFGCSRPDCIDIYTVDEVIFYRFEIEELNSLKIQGYSPDGSFEKLIDASFYITNFELLGEEYYGYLNKPIRTDLDYLFFFSQSERWCKITNIQVKEELCYNGMFVKEYIKSFNGYYVDTLRFACQILKVFPK